MPPEYYGIWTGDATVPSALRAKAVEVSVDALVDAPQILFAGAVPATTVYVDAIVDGPELALAPGASLGATSIPVYVDALVDAPTLFNPSPTSDSIKAVDVLVDAMVDGPVLQVGDPTADTVKAVEVLVDSMVDSPSLGLETPGANLVQSAIVWVDSRVDGPVIFQDSPGVLSAASMPVYALSRVDSPQLSTGAPAADVIDSRSVYAFARVDAPALDTGSPTADIIKSRYVRADAIVDAPGILVFQPAAQAIESRTVQVDAKVDSPQLVLATPAAETVPSRIVYVDALVDDPTLTVAQPPTEISNAACFQGDGFLDSEPESFTTYLPSISNGYVSVWFQFTGNPIEYEDRHKMVILQVNNQVEDLLEFGVGKQANVAYANLYIERNDDRDYGTEWTDFEGQEDDGAGPVPDIYDGEWHHLVWGNERIGVTNPDGWYFFVDGVQYGEAYSDRDGSIGPIDDWFKEVQDFSGISPLGLNRITVAATRLGGAPPTGDDNVHACIDELLIVNDRTIHDRGVLTGEVLGDVAYLYNSGNGRWITEIEADNPNGLWNFVWNAWRFEVGFEGEEYRNPSATNPNIHDLPNILNLTSATGIPGG